ncbi:MAG TPA: hypothetical protein PKA00_23005 [Saprospiraceae bacterium]|nr:hypothetical protein [Saprospiraceae bacterium]
MKLKFYHVIALFMGLSMQHLAFAVENNDPSSLFIAAIQPTVADSATVLTPEPMKKNWLQKILERKIEKKLKKAEKRESKGKQSKLGLASVLLAIGGVLFMLIPVPVIAVLGLLMLPIGLGLGIAGIKKDENNTLAIIGTIVTSLMLVLILLAVILVILAFSNF